MGATLAARGTNRTEMAQRVLESIRETGAVVVGVKRANLSPDTWYKWLREDPELRERAQEALNEGLRAHLDIAQGIGHTLAKRALETEDREAQLDYLRGYVSPVALRMAQARLPEYKRETTVQISATLEIGPSLAAAISGPPEVIDPVTEAIDVTPRIDAGES